MKIKIANQTLFKEQSIHPELEGETLGNVWRRFSFTLLQPFLQLPHSLPHLNSTSAGINILIESYPLTPQDRTTTLIQNYLSLHNVKKVVVSEGWA